MKEVISNQHLNSMSDTSHILDIIERDSGIKLHVCLGKKDNVFTLEFHIDGELPKQFEKPIQRIIDWSNAKRFDENQTLLFKRELDKIHALERLKENLEHHQFTMLPSSYSKDAAIALIDNMINQIRSKKQTVTEEQKSKYKVDFSNLEMLDSVKSEQMSETSRVHLKNPDSTVNPRIDYFKKTGNTLYNTGKIAEIESAIAAIHRVHLGYDMASVENPVYDSNQRKGIHIKGFENFKPFESYIKRFRTLGKNLNEVRYNFNYQVLIQYDFIEILVASYVFMNQDLHAGNWGTEEIAKNVYAFRVIDFDRAMIALTHKYHGLIEGFPYPNIKVDKFEDILSITKENIINFPRLDESQSNWIYQYKINQTRVKNTLLIDKISENLQSHPDFEKRKWTAFLKMILIPQDLFATIFSNYIGDKNTADKYTNFMSERLNQLKACLLEIPAFRTFVLNAEGTILPEMLKKIEDEYNAKLSTDIINKEEYVDMKLDIEAVKKNFATLRSEVEKIVPKDQIQNKRKNAEAAEVGIASENKNGTPIKKQKTHSDITAPDMKSSAKSPLHRQFFASPRSKQSLESPLRSLRSKQSLGSPKTPNGAKRPINCVLSTPKTVDQHLKLSPFKMKIQDSHRSRLRTPKKVDEHLKPLPGERQNTKVVNKFKERVASKIDASIHPWTPTRKQ